MRFFPGVTSGGEHSDVSSLRTSVTDEARRKQLRSDKFTVLSLIYVALSLRHRF